MAPHFSTLTWKIPWAEEPRRLQSTGSQRVGHDWATSLSLFTFMNWRRKWQPTPVFLPGESQGRRSLVGCRLWGRRVRHDWSDLAAAAAARKIICQQTKPYAKSYANKPNLEEMDKFLETHRLPRLNHEEIESLNTLVTGKEINSIVKNISQTKVQDQVDSLVNSQKFEEQSIPILLKLSPKREE